MSSYRQQITFEGSSSGAISTSEAAYHIQQQLNELKKSTQECGLEIERTRQMQETHSLNFYKHHQITGEPSCVLMLIEALLGSVAEHLVHENMTDALAALFIKAPINYSRLDLHHVGSLHATQRDIQPESQIHCPFAAGARESLPLLFMQVQFERILRSTTLPRNECKLRS